MASVQEHYDRHLGPVYGWMIGHFDVANSYPKLRLSPDWARATLNRLGLSTTIESGPSGMARLVARSV